MAHKSGAAICVLMSTRQRTSTKSGFGAPIEGRPTPRVRSWTRQASYTCRYRLADIVPSWLPCGPNLVAVATAAACRRAGRNPCRSFVAAAPFLLSVRLELPRWKCSAGRDARSLGQARASGRDRPRGECSAATDRRGLWRVGRTDRPGVPLCVAIRQVAHAAAPEITMAKVSLSGMTVDALMDL